MSSSHPGTERRRRSSAEIASQVEAFRRSGLSAEKFAGKHGVCVQTVYRWLRADQPGAQALVPVQITAPATRDPVRFVHASGWQVELPASIAHDQLLQLITGLASC